MDALSGCLSAVAVGQRVCGSSCTDGRNWGGCYGSMNDAAIDWEWSENSLDSISGVYGIDARAMLHDAVLAVHIAA